jgi:hypothetical protein
MLSSTANSCRVFGTTADCQHTLCFFSQLYGCVPQPAI